MSGLIWSFGGVAGKMGGKWWGISGNMGGSDGNLIRKGVMWKQDGERREAVARRRKD